MKKAICLFLLLNINSLVLAGDIIVTKQNQKYYGTVIDRNDKGFVMRTVEGNMVVIPLNHISKIVRNNLIYDLEEGTKYYLEKRHPFLPFIVLGVATGIYSVKKFQDYQDHHREAEELKIDIAGPEYTNLRDQSKKDLAWCVVSGLFSVGSFFIAFKPMEVKIPIGRINVSTTSNGFRVALHF